MKKELKNTKKKNNKGFSLVELIVVIAIMAVLMAVLAPAMLRYVEKSRIQKDDSAVSEAANAAQLALADETVYNAVNGQTPITVTVSATAINDNVSGSNAGIVAAEVKKTVGDTISFASKKRKGDTATITLEYNTTKEAYVIKGTAWGKDSKTTTP